MRSATVVMRSAFERCVRHPKRVLAVAALAVVMALPGLARLKLRTDGHALVPGNDARVLQDTEVRKTFGAKDLIAVTITAEHAPSVFNEATLTLVRDLSTKLSRTVGIQADDVLSLATEKRDRVWPGTSTFRTFLEPFPATPAALAQVRADVHAIGLLHGTIVSYDERTTAVLVGVGGDQDRTRVYDDIRTTIDESDLTGHTVRIVGAPVAESQLGRHILSDLAILVPLVIAVIAALIFALTGTVWAVFVGVGEVATTLLVTFGAMGYAGIPVYLTTAILPVTLTAVAVADDIHVFGHYLSSLARSPSTTPQAELIVATMVDIGHALVLTSLTTAIAFLSFTASPIWPIRAFGLFQCLGVMIAMVWSLVVTPAALVLVDARRSKNVRARSADASLLSRSLSNLGERVIRRKKACLAAIAACIFIAPPGIARLYVQDSWIDGFSPRSAFYRNTSFVDRHFHGTHVLDVTVATPANGGLLVKEQLERVGALEGFIEGLPGVGGVLGPHSHLATMFYLFKGRNDLARQIPRDPVTLRELVDYMQQVRGERRTREIIDREGRRGLVTAFLEQANFVDTRRIMTAIEEFGTRELSSAGIALGFAGDVFVSQATIPAIVSSQLSSLLLTLVGVCLVVTALTRSLAQGLCCLFPATAAATLVFAFMGTVGMPLGVATSMFCAITVGVGVDYSVHFVSRCRKLVAAGRDTERAIVETMMSSGRAISIDAMAVAAGFAVLAVSTVPANRRLGCLIALSVGLCYAITMAGLPALLATWRPRFVRPSER